MAPPNNTATRSTSAPEDGKAQTDGADAGKATPGPQATAEGNTTGANPNPPASAEDKTKSTDPTPGMSAGAENPNQPAAGAYAPTPPNDAQGHSSREAENARVNDAGQANGTVGVNNTLGTMPSEAAGFSPIPSDETGEADSNKVPYTQATQRIVHPDHMHPIAQALSTVANVPPGSRPMMVDPSTGQGYVPPQIAEHDAEAAEGAASKSSD